MLTGCRRPTSEPYCRPPVIPESSITEIPLPLLNSDIIDVSTGHNASVVLLSSLFSINYIKKFFNAEMDRLGWICSREWSINGDKIVLLFEQAEQRLLIELIGQQDDTCSITLYRSPLDKKTVEYNFLRYIDEE